MLCGIYGRTFATTEIRAVIATTCNASSCLVVGTSLLGDQRPQALDVDDRNYLASDHEYAGAGRVWGWRLCSFKSPQPAKRIQNTPAGKMRRACLEAMNRLVIWGVRLDRFSAV